MYRYLDTTADKKTDSQAGRQMGTGTDGHTFIFKSYFNKKKIVVLEQGIARTQSSTMRNHEFELPTFGAIVQMSATQV
jgi:hypothetical protein